MSRTRRMASARWGEAIRGACLLPGSAAVVVPVGGWEVVLAVDEDVVGGVGDGDGGGGLRVAGTGRLHAAVGVEAEHLHGVGQQSGKGAFLGGVEVQLGDVAGAVSVFGDDLAGDAAAVRGLPLRQAGGPGVD